MGQSVEQRPGQALGTDTPGATATDPVGLLRCIRAPGLSGSTSFQLPCDGRPRGGLPFAMCATGWGAVGSRGFLQRFVLPPSSPWSSSRLLRPAPAFQAVPSVYRRRHAQDWVSAHPALLAAA